MNPVEQRATRLGALPWRDAKPPTTLGRGTLVNLRDLWSRRHLLNLLVRREIRAKYKNSALGMVWSLIKPLVQLLVYYFVVGKFLGAARSIPDFAIYVYTGLALWTLFNEIVNGGTASVVNNAAIVKKVRLPGAIFPLSAAGNALFNFAVQLVVLFAMILIVGRVTPVGRWGYLPLAIAVMVVWGTALGVFLAAANVYLRDTQYLVEVALMIGFWGSPIVYSWAMVQSVLSGTIQAIYLMNPMTLGILGIQKALWAGKGIQKAIHGAGVIYFPPSLLPRMWIALGIGLVGLFFAQWYLSRLQGNFAQEI